MRKPISRARWVEWRASLWRLVCAEHGGLLDRLRMEMLSRQLDMCIHVGDRIPEEINLP